MKNKGLIIGGIAIVALGGFLWMRKRNQMAEESEVTSSDSKSDSPSANLPVKGGGTPVTTKGGSVTPTPAVNVVPMPLTLKPINNAVDLQGTKLGTDIGLTNATSAVLGNVTRAIVRLGSVGREVLNYISDTNSLQRATPEFKKGLDAKIGEGASKGNFATRLAIYLSLNKGGIMLPFPAPFEDTTNFSADALDYENEDFAFNGHTF
jgi:hypothetical protein